MDFKECGAVQLVEVDMVRISCSSNSDVNGLSAVFVACSDTLSRRCGGCHLEKKRSEGMAWKEDPDLDRCKRLMSAGPVGSLVGMR